MGRARQWPQPLERRMVGYLDVSGAAVPLLTYVVLPAAALRRSIRTVFSQFTIRPLIRGWSFTFVPIDYFIKTPDSRSLSVRSWI